MRWFTGQFGGKAKMDSGFDYTDIIEAAKSIEIYK
jgi:hypothetical protein